MRTSIKLMLLPISLWAACTNSKKAQDLVPGTYVNHAESTAETMDGIQGPAIRPKQVACGDGCI